EYELFLRVRESVLERLAPLQSSASALAQLDVLASFAETARLFNYSRPQIGNAGALHIRDGRHPVLDQALTEERFVPNDTELGVAASVPPAGEGVDSTEDAKPSAIVSTAGAGAGGTTPQATAGGGRAAAVPPIMPI